MTNPIKTVFTEGKALPERAEKHIKHMKQLIVDGNVRKGRNSGFITTKILIHLYELDISDVVSFLLNGL